VKRGSNLVPGYACRARQASGAAACDNGTSVPAESIHAGVVTALRSTFTAERFEQHLQQIAGDDEARARRTSARERLLARIPQIGQEESNITSAIAAGGELEPLVARLKALKSERQQIEADLAELDARRACPARVHRRRRTAARAVDRLDRGARRGGHWSGRGGDTTDRASDPAQDPPMVIYIVPAGRDAWDFYGAAAASSAAG
jgi:hypothetical protein